MSNDVPPQARRETDAFARVLADKTRRAAALADAIQEVLTGLHMVDLLLGDVHADSCGSDGDLSGVDYEDAADNLFTARRNMRDLARIADAHRAEVEALRDVDRKAFAAA
jgi:hypothetical protein